jgi:hypothetical protein
MSADAWSAVLDDLDARLSAAEAGDLDALSGWAMPAQPAAPMTGVERSLASRILARQATLEERLRVDLARTAASITGMRASRPANRWATTSAPVYVDRSA